MAGHGGGRAGRAGASRTSVLFSKSGEAPSSRTAHPSRLSGPSDVSAPKSMALPLWALGTSFQLEIVPRRLPVAAWPGAQLAVPPPPPLPLPLPLPLPPSCTTARRFAAVKPPAPGAAGSVYSVRLGARCVAFQLAIGQQFWPAFPRGLPAAALMKPVHFLSAAHAAQHAAGELAFSPSG